MADQLLPTGTVTLLLADVEGSTQLWESQPEVMTAALARSNRPSTSSSLSTAACARSNRAKVTVSWRRSRRPADAVACALDLQRADLAPIKLRIGVHTGDVQLRDEGNYAGPTINKTARLRDLAHGGQTVLSAATEEMVEDQLPDEGWLTDLGRHGLRDLPRPVRVSQLCHPDLRNDFPPLRTVESRCRPKPSGATDELRRPCRTDHGDTRSLADDRLVTLDRRRRRRQDAVGDRSRRPDGHQFPDGVWYVDLAPITHPDVVPLAVARALGLPDQPGRSITETLLRSIRDRRLLLVLDNCEHLLEASAELVNDLLGRLPRA